MKKKLLNKPKELKEYIVAIPTDTEGEYIFQEHYNHIRNAAMYANHIQGIIIERKDVAK